MSAVARYFLHAGHRVGGYDRTPSELTAELEREGMEIHYDDSPDRIPAHFRVPETLVVYTPAVPADCAELAFFRSAGNRILKRSAILGLIARDKRTLAVAGTHGKTTTSTLLAHLLTAAGKGCTAFLGGISKNCESNLVLSGDEPLVAEADEYDRSFLQLHPHVAVVTAADADHLDIYGTESDMKAAFGEFAGQIDPDGLLILRKGVEFPTDRVRCRTLSYALDDATADFYAANVTEEEDGCFRFDIHTPEFVLDACTLGMPGLVNVENAVAAVAAATVSDVSQKDSEKLRAALASFAGVARRFDVRLNTPRRVLIDDYAHHPAELRAAILSVRRMFPGRKITGIFQPHLYTRTRDFADGFAESLALLDALILLDIYPARELPIEGVSSKMILDRTDMSSKTLCTKDGLLDLIRNTDTDVLITLGAGDIDRLVEPLNAMLQSTCCNKQ
jgi:UDP-N-acetylmuramate--alanine ligase